MSNLNYDSSKFKKSGFEVLDEKIFIKRKVLSDNYILSLLKTLTDLSESDWFQHGNYEIGDMPEDCYTIDKISIPISMLNELNNIVSELLAPEYWGVKNFFMSRLKQGQKLPLQKINIVSEDGKKQFNVDYVATIPVGNWKGGEYFFPNKNISLTLNPGDLLIFGADEDYAIDIKEITEGIRYASFMPLIKHPPWVVL